MKRRNIKKVLKAILIVVCILFICTSILSTIMATDTIHLACCDEDDCPICTLIQTAINFTKNLNYIIEYIVLLDVSILLFHIVIYKISQNTKFTLVELKVRLDE